MANFSAILCVFWVLFGVTSKEAHVGVFPKIKCYLIKRLDISDHEKGKYLLQLVSNDMTTGQVRVVLGDPDMSEGHGTPPEDWVIYTYSWYGIYVTFKNGLVVMKDFPSQ